MASSGAVALYHIIGITPEAPTLEAVIDKEVPVYTFGKEEYKKAFETFNYSGDVDFVVLGCPHASIQEVKVIATLLKDKIVKIRNLGLHFSAGQGGRLRNRLWAGSGSGRSDDRLRYLPGPLPDSGGQGIYERCYQFRKACSLYQRPVEFKIPAGHVEDCVKAAVNGRLE